MKLKLFAASAAAALLAAAPAWTATVGISGHYVYASRTLCQPTIQLEYAKDSNGQTFLNGLNLTTPESSAHEVGLATFDPSTMTVTFKATRDSGDDVLLQTSSGVQGSVLAEKTESGSAAYANSATTVTLNGTTYSATYGKTSKGIADYFALVGLDGAGCSQQWEFTLK